MKQAIIILMLLFGVSKGSYGQADYATSILRQISVGIKPDADKLKDSIAFYSFAYKLAIKKYKDSTVVTDISVNDSIESLIVPSREFLKSINYISLMGKRKNITLVIPVSVIVTDFNSKKENQKKISFFDFTRRIEKLFNVDATSDNLIGYDFFKPIIIYLDKRVYD